MKLHATVNGHAVEWEADATTMLLELLRSQGLTGTKEGCGIGVCGLCTIVVDGLPVSSCLYLAACAEGADIRTVEGIAETEPDLVDTFIACEGMQCGICTPGQIATAWAARRDGVGTADDGGSEDEIRSFLAGNLCRCTGYTSIVEAVRTYLAR